MFHYGRGHHSGTFQETYRAFPMAFIDKQSADYGDKVILPPSALHKLGECTTGPAHTMAPTAMFFVRYCHVPSGTLQLQQLHTLLPNWASGQGDRTHAPNRGHHQVQQLHP